MRRNPLADLAFSLASLASLFLAVGLLAPASARGEEPPSAEAQPPVDEPAAAVEYVARSEDVRYANGAVGLAAELLLPAGSGPFPAAVILQGSGTSDRGNSWARSIAELLRDEGLAVLLTDKRGSGESGGDWRSASFGDLAGDGLAGVHFLLSRPEVDGERIGLVGLSQGGWIAPVLASARAEQIAFVINISGAAVGFAEQVTFEMANTARRAGLDAEGISQIMYLQQLASQYLSRGEWQPYADALEAAKGKPWAEVAAGFPDAPDQPVWSFLRRVYAFSPSGYWLAVTAPTLVVYGAEDESDNVPVAESVRRLEFLFGLTGKKDARIEVLPGLGHGLQDPETGELALPFRAVVKSFLAEYGTPTPPPPESLEPASPAPTSPQG